LTANELYTALSIDATLLVCDLRSRVGIRYQDDTGYSIMRVGPADRERP